MKNKDKIIDKNTKMDDAQIKQSHQTQLALYENKKLNIWATLFFLVLGMLATAALFLPEYILGNELEISDYIRATILWLFVSSVCIILWNIDRESKITRYRKEKLAEEIDSLTNGNAEDVFDKSLQISHEYLKQYYFQTGEHAQKGFKIAKMASIYGAVIVTGGIIAMFFGKGDAAYVTTASGVITEFISAVFFYLYNKTVQSMGAYHNKLVLSQNIALAIKIADSMSDDVKNDAKRDIINELIKDANNHFVEKSNN